MDVRNTRRHRRKPLSCQRCRDRKTKCDNAHPRCGQCERADQECVPQKKQRLGQHFDAQNEALLERLALLEHKLEVQSRTTSRDVSHQKDADNAVAMSADEADALSQNPQQHFEGRSGRVDSVGTPAASSQWDPAEALLSLTGDMPETNPRIFAVPSSSAAGLSTSPQSERQIHTHFCKTLFNQASPIHDNLPALGANSSNAWGDDYSQLDAISTVDACAYFEAYLSYVHPQYPFLDKAELVSLCRPWTTGASTSAAQNMSNMQRYIVYLVFSIGATIFDGSQRHGPARSDLLYDYAHKNLIPKIFRSRNLIDQTTVLLLIIMRDLHCPSSNAIIQHVAAVVRMAITAGLHRQAPQSADITFENVRATQMRRRIWWCCYSLDRAVALAFGHPLSVSDDFITSEMFSGATNPRWMSGLQVENQDVMAPALAEDVSCAYHLTLVRKIQSRIITTFSGTMHQQSTQSALERLRSQFCQELEDWQTAIPVTRDKPGYGGHNWFRMIALYSVLGLVSSSKDDIRQTVGAKAVVACCNACITFQKISRSRQIAPSWLAVISQFQAGVTIIYCFWSTPPEMRTMEFDPTYASRGVRTCSNNLVILAERWSEAEAYRDIFEVLTKAVPLTNEIPAMASRRLSPADLVEFERLVADIKYLGSHFRVIEMLEEVLQAQRPASVDGNCRHTHQPPIHLSTRGHEQSQVPTYSDLDRALESVSTVNAECFGFGDLWTNPLNHVYM